MKFTTSVEVEVTKVDGEFLTEADMELIQEKLASYVRYGVHHLAENQPKFKFTAETSQCAVVDPLNRVNC